MNDSAAVLRKKLKAAETRAEAAEITCRLLNTDALNIALWILAHDLARHLLGIQSLPPVPPGVGENEMQEIIVRSAMLEAKKQLELQAKQLH